ncbi:hypothetical protein SAMN04515665_11054 [Blastococcus sp. DSM 46786]|uniref:hypothetical protein n=1 Tax=Blastococcus sp. DSM 46786 TaxID=1798227 RepID=UPI0008D70566|nr:hypothetical protein [Blastococcus sp. DSM 46786]SEL24154.1 hypothetical protein SAMN04515665_11054 [Blastococcus sp. DSM 46786]
MATGRIRRSARRGVAVALLGWLGITAASVTATPAASAAPTATVPIRDLTQLIVSIDEGGAVTFVNELQDRTLQVGGGGLLPSLVSVTASTEVTLTVPSGQRTLAPGASVTERFDRSCVTGCWLTFTYSMTSGAALTQPLIDATTALLPPLPRPQPLVVNTLLPLPNVPGVNLPQLPPVTLPATPPSATPPPAPAPEAPQPPTTAQPPAQAGPAPQDVPGDQYTYETGSGGAAQLLPGARAAAAAFDPSRFVLPGLTGSSADGGGSGGVTGTYDGAAVPEFGQLAGLSTPAPGGEDAGQVVSATGARPVTLPVAALAAVVALAAVTAALVRTAQAARGSR